MVDLDVAFKFTVAVGTTMNAYANFGVLTILAWELVFVILPTIYLSILIQVIHYCMMFTWMWQRQLLPSSFRVLLVRYFVLLLASQ